MQDKPTHEPMEKTVLNREQLHPEHRKEICDLLEENRILTGVFNGIPDIIGIQKPDHTILRYNKAGYEALKKEQGDVTGKRCYSLIGRNKSCDICATHRALKSKKLETVERYVPELNRFFICRSNPVIDGSGNVSHIVEQLQDITERKSLEREKDTLIEQLQHAISDLNSRALYKMLAEKIREGVIVGHDEQVVYANPSALDILKMDEQDLSRTNIKEIIHADQKGLYDSVLVEIQEGRTCENMEFCCINGDGKEIWIQADCKPLEWHNQGGVLITFMDITVQREKRQIEKEQTLRLKKENRLLKSKHMHPYGLAHLVGTSAEMQGVYDKIIRSATIEENVIIYGESGTGKELVAQSIHDLSDRCRGPFVAVNCGAIPDNLVESEFFGHKKGAFSGAGMDKLGFFDSADRGTLFLDEIGEIPLSFQVKLLRAIEGYGYSPVGSTQVKKADIRIIAATNRDMKAMVNEGSVREDFYFRIHIIPILLPPLRERREDIPLLVYHFIKKMEPDATRPNIPDDAIEKFMAHDWPGNVRELQNTISRYLAFDRVEFAGPGRDSEGGRPKNGEAMSGKKDLNALLNAYESRVIRESLAEAGGNKSQAAKTLGIDRRSLHRKMSRLGL